MLSSNPLETHFLYHLHAALCWKGQTIVLEIKFMGTHPQDPLPLLHHTLFSKNTGSSSTSLLRNTLSQRAFQSDCFLYHFLPPLHFLFFFFLFLRPHPISPGLSRCLRTGTEPRALIIMISCGALWLQLLRAEGRSPASGAGRELGSNPWLSKTPPPYPKQNLVRIILPVFRTRQLAKHFVLHLRKTMNT